MKWFAIIILLSGCPSKPVITPIPNNGTLVYYLDTFYTEYHYERLYDEDSVEYDTLIVDKYYIHKAISTIPLKKRYN